MSIVWPPSLPQELRIADHAVTFPSGVIRTQMDAGPAKVRRRFSSAPVPHRGSIVVDGEQLETLWLFFEQSTSMGAEAFEWVDPRTGNAAMVRFLEPPQTSPLAPRSPTSKWTVTLAIEVLAAAVAPASPDPGNAQISEEVAWGPWYRGFEDSPAGEIDPSFRGASIESSGPGGGDGGMTGIPGAAAGGVAAGGSHGGGIIINFA